MNTTRKFQTDPERNTAKQHSPASQIAPQPKRKEPGDKTPETNKNDTGTTFTTEITTKPTTEQNIQAINSNLEENKVPQTLRGKENITFKSITKTRLLKQLE